MKSIFPTLKKNLFALILILPLALIGQTSTSEFYAEHDAYLQDGSRFNTTQLRVEGTYRIGFLKFNIGTVNGSVNSAKLRLKVKDDPGGNIIRVNKGVGNNWEETTLTTSNRPTDGVELGSYGTTNTDYNPGDVIDIPLDDSQLGTGIVSLVLNHTKTLNSDDTNFYTRESTVQSYRPHIIIEYTPNTGDTTAPAPVPSNVVASNATQTTVDLSWSGSTDSGSGLKEYIVRAQTDGSGSYTQIATATGTSASIGGLSPATAYRFTVSAIDNATPGNESGQSSPSASISTLSSGNGGSTSGEEKYTQSNAANPTNESAVTTGWSAHSSALLTAESSQSFVGSHSIKIEAPSTGYYPASYEFPMVIGKDYVIKIHAKNASSTYGGFWLWEGFGSTKPSVSITNTNWTEYVFNVTAELTTGKIKIYPADGAVAGDAVYFDNISIIEVGTDPPPPTGGTGGHWTKPDGSQDIHYTAGNVGIGTTNIDGWQLAVGGKIRAEEIKVETGWADYVFFNDYRLPTLEEVEAHIQEKGHLINIPSAADVQANGIELGEMNKLLLEKIEELTLYIIQQEKRIQELENNK